MIALDFADDPRRGCAPGKVDPNIFFADRREPELEEARAVCSGCQFQQACVDRALDRGEEHGLWGGVLVSSKVERRKAQTERENRLVSRLWGEGIDDTAISLRMGFDIHPSTVAKIRKRLGLSSHFGPGGRRKSAWSMA